MRSLDGRKLWTVIRYCGQALPEGPRIALIANDAIGNFVMATPVLQLLRAERTPSHLDYFGGTRTAELQRGSDLADGSYCLHGASREEVAAMLADRSLRYDLVVNMESTAFSKAFAGLLAGDDGLVAGPSIAPGGRGELAFSDDERGRLWADTRWIAEDLTTRYPFLRSGFIAEIFARLCYLEGELPPYRVPREEPGANVPDVLIATAASLPEKLWPAEKWVHVLSELRKRGFSAGLIGAKPAAQGQFWKGADAEDRIVESGGVEDLRGKFTLPQVVGALGKARAVLSLDNGVLHLAVAAGTPIIGLYREGIHRLWAPPADCLTVIVPPAGSAVAEISETEVWEALCRVL